MLRFPFLLLPLLALAGAATAADPPAPPFGRWRIMAITNGEGGISALSDEEARSFIGRRFVVAPKRVESPFFEEACEAPEFETRRESKAEYFIGDFRQAPPPEIDRTVDTMAVTEVYCDDEMFIQFVAAGNKLLTVFDGTFFLLEPLKQ